MQIFAQQTMDVRRALPLLVCASLCMHMLSITPVALAQTELSFSDRHELCDTKISSIDSEMTTLVGFCSDSILCPSDAIDAISSCVNACCGYKTLSDGGAWQFTGDVEGAEEVLCSGICVDDDVEDSDSSNADTDYSEDDSSSTTTTTRTPTSAGHRTAFGTAAIAGIIAAL